jgi:hypothetical protein
MRKKSFVVRGAQCLQALMAVALFAHCGGSDRKFGGGTGGSGGASAGAAGRVNGASGSSHAGTAGTAGGGLAEAAASGVADSAGEAGIGGSLAGAGGASGGGDSGGDGGSSGGNPSAGMGGGPPAVGSPCATGSDCAGGNCIDGVCCEGLCAGCKACSTALTGKANGTCAPVLGGQDPHNQCADETATNQCGNDGMCDGNGACRKVSTSKACAAAACGSSGFTPARTCDGLGECKTAAAESCGSYPCTLSGCAKTCSAQSDCSGSSYCNITSGTSGTCTSKKTNGTAATQSFECSSAIVADGVCCDQACTGCKACSGAPLTGGAAGQCLNVVAGQDAHNTCAASGKACGLDGACDGTGACRSAPLPGAACSDDPANKCITGGTCQAGVCAGASTPACAAPAKCKGPGTCVPASGLCSYPDLSNTTCDDGNACTLSDKCTAGVCGGTQNPCNTPPPCKVSTTCSAGQCNYTNAANGVTDNSCPASAPGKVCNAGTCVKCTTDAHCASSTSTPSCSTSQSCVCRIKDPNNLILNPNFDGNLSGWTVVSPSSTPLQADVENCPQSNSVYVNGGNLEQCIGRVKENTTYYLGAMSKQGSPGDYLRATFFSGIDCGGSFFDNPIEVYFAWGSSGWAPTDKANASAVSPAGAKSAFITSYSSVRGIDQVYFGTVDHY